jgi:hypothetical protein
LFTTALKAVFSHAKNWRFVIRIRNASHHDKNEQEYYAALKEVSPLYDLDPPDGSRKPENWMNYQH